MNLTVAASRQSAAIFETESVRRSTETPLRFRGSKRELWVRGILSPALSSKGGEGDHPLNAPQRSVPGLLLCLALLGGGCATPSHPEATTARRFDFQKDTLSYENGLVWEYFYDTNGKWTTRRRSPQPSYSQHCFVVSRSACQFFENAEFAPQLPKTDEASYRHLVRQLVHTSLRSPLEPGHKIVFPGYPNLRAFSTEHEQLLKAECGGAWQCYFQRGNWRMIFPFRRRQQAHVAEELQEDLQSRGATVVHLVRFPQLSINHAVLLFGAKTKGDNIEFDAYDPNEPSQPAILTFDRNTRTFYLPYNAYFRGGRVDVYPIYESMLY
jgi:hypothetical protein